MVEIEVKISGDGRMDEELDRRIPSAMCFEFKITTSLVLTKRHI